MLNSQQKGKRFEREVAKEISDKFGIKCSRTPCSGGMDIKGDIISLSGIPAWFHWECKNQEKVNIWKSMEQAERDCRGHKIAAVVFKRNHSKTYVMLDFSSFLDILVELKEHSEK